MRYLPVKTARSTILPIRDLRYHVREWGDAAAPLLVMVHGWMDVSASFQFLVDALKKEWHVVAPDWRGYGLTDWTGAGSYWIPDYIADLDALLAYYSPDAPVDLVGHSMGGNIATLYSGVRPERIRTLVNLEGLGMPGDAPQKAPARLAKWLSELREPPVLRPYPNLAAVVERLLKTNPRLRADRAEFLAAHWSRERDDHQFEILGDPAHKVVNPYIYRADEIEAIWSCVTARVLWVMARDSEYAQKMDAFPGYAERIALIRDVTRVWIEDAGHMFHHDQPEILAQLIEDFIIHRDSAAAA